MARTRTDTRSRIRETALELIVDRGYESTSLRAIAERLGITKAALYYHFPSKAELLRDLVRPLVEDIEAMLARVESAEPSLNHRALLAESFDLTYRHRKLFQVVLRDLGTVAQLDLVPTIMQWRTRVAALLAGADPNPAEQARVVVALGGLQDSAALFPDTPVEWYRTAALDAACRALDG